MQVFVIDKVGWHTNTPGNTETRDAIIKRFYQISLFLEKNKLYAKKSNEEISMIDDEYQIKSDELSDVGLELMRISYDKWLRKIDKGMDPQDVSLLERELMKIRSRMS